MANSCKSLALFSWSVAPTPANRADQTPGYINFEPKGENGFGYDPLFLVGETGKSSAELTLEEKNSQSHRALAVKKLLEVFPSWQSKPSL